MTNKQIYMFSFCVFLATSLSSAKCPIRGGKCKDLTVTNSLSQIWGQGIGPSDIKGVTLDCHNNKYLFIDPITVTTTRGPGWPYCHGDYHGYAYACGEATLPWASQKFVAYKSIIVPGSTSLDAPKGKKYTIHFKTSIRHGKYPDSLHSTSASFKVANSTADQYNFDSNDIVKLLTNAGICTIKK